MTSNPRAALWLFSYHGAEDETWLSIIQEIQSWGNNLTFQVKAGDADIARARSQAASLFLKTPREEAGDVLLMVDSDNAWQAGDLSIIAKQSLEHTAVVGGIYSKRAFNQGVVLRVTKETEGDFTIGTDTLVEAEFVGGGFMAIPRVILEVLKDTLPCVRDNYWDNYWPFFMTLVRGNPPEYYSTDSAFCARARDAGFHVYGAAQPRMKHKGTYIYRIVDSVISPPPDRDITVHLEHAEKVLA